MADKKRNRDVNPDAVCNLCGQKLWSGGVSETGGLLPHRCEPFIKARRKKAMG